MSRLSPRALALVCALVFPAALLAQSRPPARIPPARRGVDAGLLAPDAGHLAALSLEDQEVVDNLELLEHMEESEQLELLLELSRDD